MFDLFYGAISLVTFVAKVAVVCAGAYITVRFLIDYLIKKGVLKTDKTE